MRQKLMTGIRRNPDLVDSKLESRLKSCGFESHHILDGNSFKVIQGSIPVHNSG